MASQLILKVCVRIVERLACLAVPYYSSFTLIGDTDCLDLTGRKSLLDKLFDCFLNAAGHGGDQFERIMFVPSNQTSQ
jgi:hypothetical protein